ncbi:metal ABC transporter permease [Leptolyngbya sp. 15MV]|nr:metal ABC transporter permease [Leptolyngbya sp. 15MV]
MLQPGKPSVPCQTSCSYDEVVRRLARLEAGAAMGVVFSAMFALGVVLIERAAVRGVDLDPDCVLNGQLERVFWFPPAEWGAMLSLSTIAELPRELVTLAVVYALAVAAVGVFYKELRLVCFDPALASSLGLPADAVRIALLAGVAAAVVASFEVVGSILVIAMLVCPPAAARMLTDRLGPQILVSQVVALATGVTGYTLAAHGPRWIGVGESINAAGMMAVVGGAAMAGAILLAPKHGVLARARRRRRVVLDTAAEDLLADLYRAGEPGHPIASGPPPTAGDAVLSAALARREITLDTTGAPRLTDRGRERAERLVRAHRLWESYLVWRAGLRPDHVHDRAMELEHITDEELARRVASEAPARTDPHGKPIPPSTAEAERSPFSGPSG